MLNFPYVEMLILVYIWLQYIYTVMDTDPFFESTISIWIPDNFPDPDP